jgi:hypothetical protein
LTWQQWSIDLSAYAGESVEISIAYASDWATQGFGVFVDSLDSRENRALRT